METHMVCPVVPDEQVVAPSQIPEADRDGLEGRRDFALCNVASGELGQMPNSNPES